MITIDDVADCMALPVALYPSFPFQEPQLLAYYELLKDLDSKEQLFSAIKVALRASTFFPSVALILDEAKGTRVPAKFNSLELANSKAVPMPEHVKELREYLRFVAKTPDSSPKALSSPVEVDSVS